jgi:glycosyltransferase involved in cell wall biosynthesis
MIIGYEAKRVFQNFSGLGNYSRNLINLLARYFPENTYKLFAPKLTSLYTPPDSAVVITPKSFFSRHFRSYWRLHKTSTLLLRNNIDVFHGLSHVLPFGIDKTGIPSVVTIHDLIFLRYPEYYKKLDRKMYLSICRGSCRRATKIIAISHQTKADLIRFFGIDPGKIEVIYQTCDSRFFDKQSDAAKSAVRNKFNLPDKFILCVGTIEKRKNQLAILKAVAKEKIDTPVVILGKPTEYLIDLNQFIRESGISKQVIFLHNTSFEELQTIYQTAEVMIYPSFFEGFGLPVLEAQASGCPVITSNVSSLPEAGGEGALYINPSDISEIGLTLRKILSDDAIRKEMIQRGTINTSLFSDKLVAERLMELYRELTGKT